ncbi:MAG TPA: hypothetical protein VF527_05720 [Pyrinomonadaceae bacterium]|jgi:hypothetical protein
MNARSVKTFVLTVGLLSLSIGAHAQKKAEDGGGQGELRLYDRATQIGTAANRVFRDARGRVVKTIYYTGDGGLHGAASEDSLREQSIRVTTYDDYDCPVKNETYEPGMKLAYTSETRCRKETATPHTTIGRNARGVKQTETRHEPDGRTRASLYFDDEGERVVSIWGAMPSDVDLVHGWGKEVSGFTTGIAASRERGRQTELRVWVTIRNISNREEGGLVMISPVAFELRDAAGRLVAPKANTTEAFAEGAATTACPDYEGRGVPRAGAAELLRSYELAEQYDPLPPGSYSVTLKHCLSSKRQLIVSNTIHLEVTGQE